MHFIIPKNYTIKPKLLGTFDYSSVVLSIIFIIITFSILSLFPISITNKISIIIIINLPIFLLLNFGLGNENIIYILYNLLKYLFSPKIYIYYK